MRTFIAINFSQDVKNRLIDIEKNLKSMSEKGRFTSKDNLHLTLVFLGEIAEDRVKLAQLCVKNITAPKFEMVVNRLGRFKRPEGDIYWAGIETNTILNSIYSQLYKNLNSYDFYIKDSEYIPHLTLARDYVMKDEEVMEKYKENFEKIIIQVDNIQLMKSEMLDNKLTYTALYTKELDSTK
ncbi:MAG: RNA 2',3'-cyclic phosphodiesterase [Clostridia bacterium]|jgi:2'-5' RNA ligase